VGLPALPGLIQATLHHFNANYQGGLFWGFLDAPNQAAINALHPRLGKLVEVGWVYTVIAGLLNILAIFDAYEGPAHADADEATESSSGAEATPKADAVKVGGAA